MPASEEEQKVEAVKRKARPENGVPGPPCAGLAAPDARNDEHRDTTKDEEQYIDQEHVDTSQLRQASGASECKTFEHIV
jgi:hypothetical protein